MTRILWPSNQENETPAVELGDQGVFVYADGMCLTPADARELAGSLVAAADAWDDEYGHVQDGVV